MTSIKTFGDCTDEELRAMVAEGEEKGYQGLVATATAVLRSRETESERIYRVANEEACGR